MIFSRGLIYNVSGKWCHYTFSVHPSTLNAGRRLQPAAVRGFLRHGPCDMRSGCLRPLFVDATYQGRTIIQAPQKIRRVRVPPGATAPPRSTAAPPPAVDPNDCASRRVSRVPGRTCVVMETPLRKKTTQTESVVRKRTHLLSPSDGNSSTNPVTTVSISTIYEPRQQALLHSHCFNAFSTYNK